MAFLVIGAGRFVGLTIVVKLAFFHLSATSYKSMANMRRVAPEMKRIKEQYGLIAKKTSQSNDGLI
ncbi:MAG: YidC/Oxa1 family membrane protein insertase [Moraxellaceae bacterium]|nr:YidC/Oxa1 family membrane protein insertase [Moraxellaceae bacterium]